MHKILICAILEGVLKWETQKLILKILYIESFGHMISCGIEFITVC